MEYRRFGDHLVCRLDRGEEVISALHEIAEKEQITFGEVKALGASDDVTVGVYNVSEQKYYKNHFTFPVEITQLWGTIHRLGDDFYSHLHITVANEEGQAFGGHLNECRISATCEMVITLMEGHVSRKKDPVTGLNIFDFEA